MWEIREELGVYLSMWISPPGPISSYEYDISNIECILDVLEHHHWIRAFQSWKLVKGEGGVNSSNKYTENIAWIIMDCNYKLFHMFVLLIQRLLSNVT